MSDQALTRLLMTLTRRQREVLELTAYGLTNRQIAARLFVEPCVVASHLSNIYGEAANFLYDDGQPVNRYAIIRYYAPFFDAHPEFRPSNGFAAR